MELVKKGTAALSKHVSEFEGSGTTFGDQGARIFMDLRV